LRNQIQEITEETEMVRVLINDVQEEKRKTIESEKQRSLSFQLLQDQIDRLKIERGLNRSSLTKDAEISKMKCELESLMSKKKELQDDIKDIKEWAVQRTKELNEEKDFRKKCINFLSNLLEPRTNRVGGGYEVD